MRCLSKNKEGNPCEMSALKGEQFCLSHSNSERAKKSRVKKAIDQCRFDKNGHLTIRGFWLDLKWARRQLMADPKTGEIQRAGTLKMLDVRILKLQEMMKKSKPKKVKKLLTGTQLIRKVEGKIVKEVA
jgi:hypothetical protein